MFYSDYYAALPEKGFDRREIKQVISTNKGCLILHTGWKEGKDTKEFVSFLHFKRPQLVMWTKEVG